ncbi:hypothetical protein QBC39DRAFT_49020 [Podospora conica]|nr:hypothetical protein QBC39DRAFT_49020 [Schizothecium conicum]
MPPPSIGTRGPALLLRARLPSRSPRRHPSLCLSCSFATNPPPARTDPARRDLSAALSALPEPYTNPARVQLARHNLSQPAGHESIRLAVLAHRSSPTLAKNLLRLSLADPLQGQQPWEAQLLAHDLAQRPLLVRVVPAGLQEPTKATAPGTIETPPAHVIPELRVPSPVVARGAELEVLLMEEDTEQPRFSAVAARTTPEERLLTPEVTVAAVPEETAKPVPSPVHMALRVGEGEAAMRAILAAQGGEMVASAFQWGDRNLSDLTSLAMLGVNVDTAKEGLDAFRSSVSNALRYEAAWTKSNVGRINEWLRENVQANEAGVTKPPVRHLIRSILDRSRVALEEEVAAAAAEANKTTTPRVSPGAAARLTKALTEWSESAHSELRDMVEDALAHGPWRGLAWWKLLWRADDVGMVASEVLGRRFLLEAEKGVIFLSGRIEEAATTATATDSSEASSAGRAVEVHSRVVFPTHVGDARRFLAERTQDLQTAAQRLVLWTSGQAGVTGALGALVYLSGFGVYEAGSIAALGVVWGLTNLQRGWERARAQWEDEVRVRGRQALQLTEQSMMTTLVRATAGKEGGGEERGRLERLRGVVERAEEAFGRLK